MPGLASLGQIWPRSGLVDAKQKNYPLAVLPAARPQPFLRGCNGVAEDNICAENRIKIDP